MISVFGVAVYDLEPGCLPGVNRAPDPVWHKGARLGSDNNEMNQDLLTDWRYQRNRLNVVEA